MPNTCPRLNLRERTSWVRIPASRWKINDFRHFFTGVGRGAYLVHRRMNGPPTPQKQPPPWIGLILIAPLRYSTHSAGRAESMICQDRGGGARWLTQPQRLRFKSLKVRWAHRLGTE